MHLVYYDESGDDGFPAYAAPMFVLSAIYGPAQDWKENFERIARFKRELVRECGLPFDMELHTRELILNKKPYSALRLSGPQRLEIITRYCQMVSRLTIRSITTAVIKTIIRSHTFDVLRRASSRALHRRLFYFSLRRRVSSPDGARSVTAVLSFAHIITHTPVFSPVRACTKILSG